METPGFCVTILRYASGVSVELRRIILKGSVRKSTGGLAAKSLQQVFDCDDADCLLGRAQFMRSGQRQEAIQVIEPDKGDVCGDRPRHFMAA